MQAVHKRLCLRCVGSLTRDNVRLGGGQGGGRGRRASCRWRNVGDSKRRARRCRLDWVRHFTLWRVSCRSWNGLILGGAVVGAKPRVPILGRTCPRAELSSLRFPASRTVRGWCGARVSSWCWVTLPCGLNLNSDDQGGWCVRFNFDHTAVSSRFHGMRVAKKSRLTLRWQD